MKVLPTIRREQGLTLVELCVVVGVIGLFVLMLVADRAVPRAKERALRIQCVNNLKQTGLAFRVWWGGQAAWLPMDVSITNGGTKELINGPSAFRHFQVLSNEMSSPKVFICPADDDVRRIPATTFGPALKPADIAFASNSNISYFVGVTASESKPDMILSGDRNITNGTPISGGILELSTNHLSGWTAEMHGNAGNLLMADGSVQQVSIAGLRDTETNAVDFTNLLQMPILTP